MKPNQTIIDLAKSYGFDGAEYECEWNGCKVFNPTFDNPDKVVFIGKPILILYDGKNARIADEWEWQEYIEKIKIMDYTNLKEKTIFDFCNDEQMIADLVVSKEDYFRDVETYPLLNAHVLIEYAELTNNKDLLQAVKSQYKMELEAENNE